MGVLDGPGEPDRNAYRSRPAEERLAAGTAVRGPLWQRRSGCQRGTGGDAVGRADLRPRALARGRAGVPQWSVAVDVLADAAGDVLDRVGQGVQVPADRPER